jgi:hypothetical protein
MGGYISSAADTFGSALGFDSSKPKGSTVSNPTPTNPNATSAQPGSGQPAPASAFSNPYTTGSGVTSGQSQPQFEGLDFTKRGPGEQQWIDSRNVYNTPSFGEVNAQGLTGYYSNASNSPQVTNNVQDWFDQYRGQMPNLAQDPGLGPYFENAKNRARESIDQAAGARGNYGSSAAIDQFSRAATDLEGQRALKEADYALQRTAEDRAWHDLGGRIAGSADASSVAVSDAERNWADFLGRLGIDSSKLAIDRTNAAQDAANSAQDREATRGQNFFNNEAAAGDRMSDQMLRVLLQALGVDADLFMAENSAPIAEGNAAAANETANAATAADAAKAAYGIYSAQ